MDFYSEDYLGMLPINTKELIKYETNKADEIIKNFDEEEVKCIIDEYMNHNNVFPSNIAMLKEIHQYTLNKGDRAYSEYFECEFDKQLNCDLLYEDNFRGCVFSIINDLLKKYNFMETTKSIIEKLNKNIEVLDSSDIDNDSVVMDEVAERKYFLELNLYDLNDFMNYFELSEYCDTKKIEKFIVKYIMDNYKYTEDDGLKFRKYICDNDPCYNDFIEWQVSQFLEEKIGNNKNKQLRR